MMDTEKDQPREGEREIRITHAMEDYLKGIYRLGRGGETVTTQRLAEELGISGPSVTNMVKRLHDLNLLRHTRYQGVELTEAGERIALQVLRHHRLLELYLAESLGFPWDQVHAEAERLEHHVSDELAARMDSALGYPTIDPHGDPIPSPEGIIAEVSPRRLIDLQAGDVAVVQRVSDRDPEQLRYLGGLGLYPGVEVHVVERFPFDGPIRIMVRENEHVIGQTLASIIHIDPSAITYDHH